MRYRAVLDTNVFVSASISNGKARQLVDQAVYREQYAILSSLDIICETENTLSRGEFEKYQGALERFRSIKTSIEIVATESEFRVVRADPDDDIVINAAHDGRADYIVTGDRHLLRMGEFRGIPIITIARMLDLLQARPA